MRQAAATMVSIRSQRMSRTIKAKRYNTLAACIRRSIWNDIAYPLAVDRRFGKTPMQTFLSSWVARIECSTRTGLQSHSPALGHRAHVLIAAPSPPPDGLLRRAGDGRCPLRQARNDLPHAQATDLRLAMISNANFRFRPNSRGHRDDGCRAPQVEPESPRRAADPYHRLVA